MNSQKTKSQFTPLTFILIGIVIVLLYVVSSNKEAPAQDESPQKTRQAKIAIAMECIPWIEVSNAYEGKSVCVIGKIIRTESNFDEKSNETIYDAYFSDNPLALHLYATDRDFGQWNNECVIVRGIVTDTTNIKKYMKTSEYPPTIFLQYFTDGNSYTLFNVESTSDDLCQ